MSSHDVCLNIDASAPDDVWEKIAKVYRSMDFWESKTVEGCPAWTGENICLTASSEPGGLQISGEMPDEIWDSWYPEFKAKLTKALGYEIGEPEDGYNFKHWKPFVKSYADIKSIDDKKIVFNDLSTFFWNSFTDFERDITAKPPVFIFRSDMTELRVNLEGKGLFAKKKQHQDFAEFRSRLNEAGIRTLDLS